MGGKNIKTCEECGARVSPESDQCTLCGWPVGASEVPLPASDPGAEEIVSESRPLQSVSCNDCGWKNPPLSRYCSQCGAQLQKLTHAQPLSHKAAPKPAAARPDTVTKESRKAISRQTGIVIGAGLSLVVALFLITVVSRSTHPEEEAVATETRPVESQALTGVLAENIALLDAQIQEAIGSDRLSRLREKGVMLLQGGRADLAAQNQQRIAETTGDALDWKMAGDLYYDGMTEATDPAGIAALAIAAYQQVLDRDPDNLDVRTDMATAYLNTGSPMQGVTEIKRVLEADPTHLNANFNYGLMLARISRADKAVEQFEKVMALAGDSSAHYQRAAEVLRSIRERGGS